MWLNTWLSIWSRYRCPFCGEVSTDKEWRNCTKLHSTLVNLHRPDVELMCPHCGRKVQSEKRIRCKSNGISILRIVSVAYRPRKRKARFKE